MGRSYEAVRNAQAWMETARDAGVFQFDGTLKKSPELDPYDPSSYDGVWGPKTEQAYRAWASYVGSGANINRMVEFGILSASDAAVVNRARSEVLADSGRNEPAPTYYARPQQESHRASLVPWMIGGLLVVGALLTWSILSRRRKES